jgi:hypothetical protein
MKLYGVKKVLAVALLALISSVQLQAMSLRQLALIMFICSPGTQTVAKQYIKTIKTTDGFRIFDRYVRFPEYPSKATADIHNKNHFGTEYPATDKF